MVEITSPDEYLAVRNKHIVEEVYSGNDSLPLETKDFLLRKHLGNPQINFYSTTVDEHGRGRSNHVNFVSKVNVLEFEVLWNKGFICGKLC